MQELSLVEDDEIILSDDDTGYDPFNSAQRICPDNRRFHQQTVAEMFEARAERREEHKKASGLRGDALKWIDDFCYTGRHKILPAQ